MNTNQTVSDAGSALIGAGLTLIHDDITTALLLVGFGAGLKILVAVLQKYDIPISSVPPQLG